MLPPNHLSIDWHAISRGIYAAGHVKLIVPSHNRWSRTRLGWTSYLSVFGSLSCSYRSKRHVNRTHSASIKSIAISSMTVEHDLPLHGTQTHQSIIHVQSRILKASILQMLHTKSLSFTIMNRSMPIMLSRHLNRSTRR